jgi:hypothetical protein
MVSKATPALAACVISFLSLGFAAAMEERVEVSLNGEWLFIAADHEDYADPEFDDSNWSRIAVPGDWPTLGVQHSGYAWYRHRFNASMSDNTTPRYLRFDRIMDEGEIWLNGVKLLNSDPALCELLRDKQFGSYGYRYYKDDPYVHTFSLDWPYMFDVQGILKDGENQIAVRVFDDAARLWSGPEEQAGITEDVYLVSTGALFISEIRLIPGREVSSELTANFTFEVTLANEGDAVDGRIVLSIFQDEAKMAGGDEVWVSAGPGSRNVVNLTWTTRPMLESYVARIEVLDETGAVDVMDQKFHGTIVEVRGDKFYMNGERFIFKGVNFGFPPDFDVLSWLGMNGIRLDHPNPEHVDQGLEQGIVYSPLVGLDSVKAISDVYERPDSPINAMEMQLQVIGLWDRPNVIIWNMANEMFADVVGAERNVTQVELYLKTRYEAAHALDPYHRPVSYTNIFWQYYTFWQDIVGTNVYGSNPYIYTEKPLFMTEWGHGLVYLKSTWNGVVLNDEDDWGVMGATLYPGAGRTPEMGINWPVPSEQDEYRWGLREFMKDMDIQVWNTTDGGMTIGLKNRRFFSMEDLVVAVKLLGTGGELSEGVDVIGPYGSANITIDGRSHQPLSVHVEYTTHGGLRSVCNMSTTISPDHTYPKVGNAGAKYFQYGMSFTLFLSEACDWTMDVVNPDGLVVDTLGGSGDSISTTWNVTSRIEEMVPGSYDFVLHLTDMAGNQAAPITRYRFPLNEMGIGVLVLPPLASLPLIRKRKRDGAGSKPAPARSTG